jgi:hypothetical protein
MGITSTCTRERPRISNDAGLDVDNQFLVFRVKLPSVVPGSAQQSIGI